MKAPPLPGRIEHWPLARLSLAGSDGIGRGKWQVDRM